MNAMPNFAFLLAHPRFRSFERLGATEEHKRNDGRWDGPPWYRVTFLLPAGARTSVEGRLDAVIARAADSLRSADEWASKLRKASAGTGTVGK